MGILVDRFTLPGYRFLNVITVNRIPLENPLTPDTHPHTGSLALSADNNSPSGAYHTLLGFRVWVGVTFLLSTFIK